MKFPFAAILKKKTFVVPPAKLTARYDAAQTTSDNQEHWRLATNTSADAENSPEVRRILRIRSRYESANNAWLKGMVKTQAEDLIGTGPRLQLQSSDPAVNREIETKFQRWCKIVRLARKLRTARRCKCRDGEAFLVFTHNPKLKGEVKFNVDVIESDRVCAPFGAWFDPRNIDGILYDEWGNPVAYQILKEHPGNAASFNFDSSTVDAQFVIHLFDHDRAEQHRGVSELTPGIPLFALQRRYLLATVKKMENASRISGVIKTNAEGDYEDDDAEEVEQVQPFQTFNLPEDAFMALPNGYDLKSHETTTPTDSQNSFSVQVKTEVAKGCLGLPKNVALGDSSGYNYASGRLDFQAYDKTIRVERSDWEIECLDVIFERWLLEYRLTPDALALGDCDHLWFWDGREHVDPGKEAAAQEKNLNNNTATLAEIYGKRGLDWEEQLEQRYKERRKELELQKKYGVTLANNPEADLPLPEEKDDDDDE